MTKIDLRPSLAIRVGVTGHRAFDANMLPILRRKAGEALRLIRDETLAFATSASARAVYRRGADGKVETFCRVVSPIAAGADQIFAEEALHAGYRLYSPFPFSLAEYSEDFGDGLPEFDRLRAAAIAFPLDGERAVQNESYESVGHFVVENADVILCIWDGAPARGKGGTAEIIEFALRSGLPVWRIDSKTGDASLLRSPADLGGQQLERRDPGADVAQDEAALADLLRRSFEPPHSRDPLPLRHRRERRLEPRDEGAAANDPEAWWTERRRWLQAFSLRDRRRRRRLDLVAAAFAAAGFALSFLDAYLNAQSAAPHVVVALEAVCAIVAGLATFARRLRDRRIEAAGVGVCARLLRAQIMFAPIGRCYPAPPATGARRARGVDAAFWRLLALRRCAPPAQGPIEAAKRKARDLGRVYISEAIAAGSDGASERRPEVEAEGMTAVASFCFAAAAIACLLQLAFETNLARLGLASGAVQHVALGAQATFGLGVAACVLRLLIAPKRAPRPSARATAQFGGLDSELRRLEPREPLASQRLGLLLRQAVALSLVDVAPAAPNGVPPKSETSLRKKDPAS